MGNSVVIMDYSVFERQKVKSILEGLGDFNVIELTNNDQYKMLSDTFNDVILFIIDIAFPFEKDGLDILKQLKEDESTKDCPVIIVTKSDKLEHRNIAVSCGVRDYIIKPYHASRLENSIKIILNIQDKFIYSTNGINDISMSFEKFILKELKYADRISEPLSLIVIKALDNKETQQLKSKVFCIAHKSIESSLRNTDTVVCKNESDIIVVLPSTDQEGSKTLSQRIIKKVKIQLEKIDQTFEQFFYYVYVTHPKEGEDFQALMEAAFKKLASKEMIHKMSEIPADVRKYADKRYGQFSKWWFLTH